MQTKRITTKDGTIMITWDGKLHNWDGAALIPQGNKKKAEYYIHGIKLTLEQWKERKKERSGVPFYKNPSFKGEARH